MFSVEADTGLLVTKSSIFYELSLLLSPHEAAAGLHHKSEQSNQKIFKQQDFTAVIPISFRFPL
jgi:hypothetical protein